MEDFISPISIFAKVFPTESPCICEGSPSSFLFVFSRGRSETTHGTKNEKKDETLSDIICDIIGKRKSKGTRVRKQQRSFVILFHRSIKDREMEEFTRVF